MEKQVSMRSKDKQLENPKGVLSEKGAQERRNLRETLSLSVVQFPAVAYLPHLLTICAMPLN